MRNNRRHTTRNIFGCQLVLVILSITFSFSAHAQNNINISGKVVDGTTKLPLAGATVHIKGSTHEVITDAKGEFRFITAQHLPLTYVITYVGYETLETTQTKDELFEIKLQQANN